MSMRVGHLLCYHKNASFHQTLIFSFTLKLVSGFGQQYSFLLILMRKKKMDRGLSCKLLPLKESFDMSLKSC